MCPRGSSRIESTTQGESRPSRLPLLLFSLVLAALALVSPLIATAQETTPGQTPPAQTPPVQTPPVQAPPAQTSPPVPAQPQSTAPTLQHTLTPPVLGPDGKPYVPPPPPGPSQTRIPGAFDTSIIPTGAPRFLFTPSVTLSEEWTDNFFLENVGKTDNFRTTLALGLALLINLPNTQGSISTSLAGAYDTAPDTENFNFFPEFHATVTHTFTPRLNLVVSEDFRRGDDPLFADPNGLRRNRETFVTNTLSVSLNWLVDIFQTQLYYRNVLFFSDSSDTISHIIGGNVSMPVGALNTLTGGYEFSWHDTSENSDTFSNRVYGIFSRQIGTFTTAGLSSSFSWIHGTNDSTYFNISVIGSHGIPGGFSVSGSVGYGLFDSNTASKPTHLFTASLNASYQFARGFVQVGFFQDVRQTAEEGQDFGLVTTRAAHGSFSYPITAFINATVHGEYSRNEPLEGNSSTIPSSSILTAGANLSWHITNWLSMTLAYLYIDRKSDRNTNIGSNPGDFNRNTFLENSTENRATATITATF